jgi:hypothetical protein
MGFLSLKHQYRGARWLVALMYIGKLYWEVTLLQRITYLLGQCLLTHAWREWKRKKSFYKTAGKKKSRKSN